MRSQQYQSPPEVAKELRISVDRVLHWIKSGKLRAVNLSEGIERPRWKVDPDDLAAFLAGRSNHTTAKPVRESRLVVKPRKQHV